ncbi:MAG: acetoin utilization protein AcuC, partial [Halobacteria archaeon]|nr:acetoin utilization protein AcuC [Halobacteria archaeon]
MTTSCCVYIGDELARYGFGDGHPFGPDRMGAFWQQAQAAGIDKKVKLCTPVSAPRA